MRFSGVDLAEAGGGMRLLILLICAGISHAQPYWDDAISAKHGLAELNEETLMEMCGKTDMGRVNRHLDNILVTRVSGTPGARRVWNYLRSTLLHLGFTVESDVFSDSTPYGEKKFRNLIATWNPQAPRRLVLACHYDSKYVTKFEFLAATDSAFPCAALLEIAAELAPFLWQGKAQDVSLQLLFFDGEEAFKEWTATDSIYGARHLAAKWEKESYVTAGTLRNTLNRIDVLVLLDLLGARNPRIRNFDKGAKDYFHGLVQIESRLAKMGCLPGQPRQLLDDDRIFQAPFIPGPSRVEDDHVPFEERGVPILHMIPVPFPRVWHAAGDNRNILHNDTMVQLIAIFRTFTAAYLHITDFSRPASPMR